MRRALMTVMADSHAGNKLGLMNPDVELLQEEETENGTLVVPYTPQMTKSQEYLWDLYLQGLDYANTLAAGDENLFLHDGDDTQGNKYPQALVSTRMSDQIVIAEKNFEPAIEPPNVKRARFASGTGAHDFLEGSSTILVTQLLQRQYPEKDIKTVYHGLIEYNGVPVDYAHHGPHPGSRNWLAGNVARFYLRDLMITELKAGRKPPALVLRAHYHTFVIERLRFGGCESILVILPSMCMLGDHARQATQSRSEITNGIVIFEIVDGKILDIHELVKTMDLRTREVL